MAALIKGIPVTLYERTQTGEDAFHEPIYAETPVTVDNVLITPVDSAASPTELQLSGRHLIYELCIPKADTHEWEGCTVEFFGKRWRVLNGVQQYITQLTPLDWDKKVQVERYEWAEIQAEPLRCPEAAEE